MCCVEVNYRSFNKGYAMCITPGEANESMTGLKFFFLTACSVGKFGQNCSQDCSVHCRGQDNACDPGNGRCNSGCEDGYRGDMCENGKQKKNIATGLTNRCPEQLGATRSHQEPLGATWSHSELSGAIWSHLEPHGAIWSHTELSGVTRNYLESHGAIWSHTELSGVTRSYLESHGVTWSHSEPPGATWGHPGPPETAIIILDSI
ncbi:receptor-type tyrosine-protein phosphatase kappa [Elysia marginata]|uniref:Receptor-type tyrosine-protein phosphatase kappa n=1 Tax=Elysia marginata TaxID=1093978 RepID=A0AAV4FWG9_9GAST|nr:receptor-type tyrosine-protein phosphatase kappa [Elysia marginata]